jgi:hypothetical protein
MLHGQDHSIFLHLPRGLAGKADHAAAGRSGPAHRRTPTAPAAVRTPASGDRSDPDGRPLSRLLVSLRGNIALKGCSVFTINGQSGRWTGPARRQNHSGGDRPGGERPVPVAGHHRPGRCATASSGPTHADLRPALPAAPQRAGEIRGVVKDERTGGEVTPE